MVEQVTAVVAALIAQDPGAQVRDEDNEQGIRVLAQMLVGAVQSVANWWAEHPESPASTRSRWSWTSPGSASTASATAGAGHPGD